MGHRLRARRALRPAGAILAALCFAAHAAGAAGQGRIVNEADDGGTILARVGERFALRLPENPSTGYGWALETVDPARLEVEEGPFRAQAGRLGAGGEATWTVTARAPGTTTLGLKYWRPWEGDASVVRRFGATFRIAPAQ
ncbi:protease inhibitor I42 family protein [Methylocella sp.]|uniref:protease inhibitor I42 family protein n=1 Tax=Methylocella sp. TaxID=1978226 RepID=UPI00378381A7